MANEVKTLRQQLESCQKEKDIYFGQLQKLKEVLGGGNVFGSIGNHDYPSSQRLQRNISQR